MEDAGLAKSHAGGEEKHPATRLPSWSKQSGLVLQRNSKMISMIIDHDYKILVAQCDVIKQLVHLRSPTQDPARPFSQPGGKLPVPRDACDINISRSKDHHRHQLGSRLPACAQRRLSSGLTSKKWISIRTFPTFCSG